MKVLSLAFMLLISTPLCAQRPLWDRVYTFDDSIIEMNTQNVTLGGDVGRVEFRWLFDQPQRSSNPSKLIYKSRVEVFEFDCKGNRYRPFETTFLDAAGKPIYKEEVTTWIAWRYSYSYMMWTMLKAACGLIEEKRQPPSPKVLRDVELEKVAKYSLVVLRTLEQTKDFRLIIKEFFPGDYLNRYLRDDQTNWFFNLSRETAAKASPAELERFYVASLNSGYLSALYFLSQSDYTRKGIPDADLIPGDVADLIANHPYTAQYKGKQENYDFLAEEIDSIQRLRSYTDLLEDISAMMRKHLTNVDTDFPEYREIREDTPNPDTKTCSRECLGLPKGTTLFVVELPLLRLQLAEIKGKLKIVSASEASY